MYLDTHIVWNPWWRACGRLSCRFDWTSRYRADPVSLLQVSTPQCHCLSPVPWSTWTTSLLPWRPGYSLHCTNWHGAFLWILSGFSFSFFLYVLKLVPLKIMMGKRETISCSATRWQHCPRAKIRNRRDRALELGYKWGPFTLKLTTICRGEGYFHIWAPLSQLQLASSSSLWYISPLPLLVLLLETHER